MKGVLNHTKKRFSPAICFDVDGVLRKGKFPLPGAKESIIKLREKNIPLSIITNGGGETEYHRAEVISKILNLDSNDIKLKAEEVFVVHSPMRPVISECKNGTVLIAGVGDTHLIMKEYGCNNYITVEEYLLIFPHLFSILVTEDISEEMRKKTIKTVEERLQTSLSEFIPIRAIFMLTDVVRWEINVQLFSDLLISENGVPGTIRSIDSKQCVDFHLCGKDLVYKDVFSLPRIAAGTFWYSLEHLFFLKYKRKIDHVLYGKPSPKIFEYAKNKIEQRHPDISFTNFYMIGDNPEVDIKGANSTGFESVLVRTGVFQTGENDLENPAKYVVDDVYNGIQKILSIEGF